MAGLNQVAALSINDVSDDMGLVTNSAISFSQGNQSVTAHITVSGNYTDKSPIFDFFIQNQPATVKILYDNMIATGGETIRTIEFQNAICKDYVEVFDAQHQTFDEVNDLMIVITIQADSVSMGETSFPA